MTREEAIEYGKRVIDLGLNDETQAFCEMAIKALEQEQKWIPVNEKLPKDGKWALFTDGSNISVERYKKDAIDHFFPQERWFSFDKAIAWMPLPEPYKAENEVQKMTREEAIETLKENSCAMCAYGSQNMMSCDIRGCDNRDAIKALELEPCDDAISKQAVLDCLTATGLKKFDFILDARDKIKNLPSVTPQYTDAVGIDKES